MVRPLKKWLLRHRHNPYPTKAEKVQLALGSNMTLVQVKNYRKRFGKYAPAKIDMIFKKYLISYIFLIDLLELMDFIF